MTRAVCTRGGGGGRRGFQAVILTSLTTLGGVLPLAHGIGVRAGWIQPMVFTLGWGLLVATLLNLLFFPCFVVVLDDWRRLAAGCWRLRRRAAALLGRTLHLPHRGPPGGGRRAGQPTGRRVAALYEAQSAAVGHDAASRRILAGGSQPFRFFDERLTPSSGARSRSEVDLWRLAAGGHLSLLRAEHTAIMV